MKKLWRFSVSGLTADSNTWMTSGVTEPCDFTEAFDTVMKDTFNQLTHGKAVFGSPGVGCQGPYAIKRFCFEEVMQ